MKWIISANYKNRQSPFKWLVRQDGQHVSTARAFKNVVGEKVTVDHSSVESGFGCSRVMVAEFVTCTNAEEGENFNSRTQAAEKFTVSPEVKEAKLRFDGFDFKTTEGNKTVYGGEVVTLSDNGMVMTKPLFSAPAEPGDDVDADEASN